MSEWISVKDRLPVDWEYVVAVNSNGAMHILNHIWLNKTYPQLGYLGKHETPEEGTVDKLHGVTHWMPLPPPPVNAKT